MLEHTEIRRWMGEKGGEEGRERGGAEGEGEREIKSSRLTREKKTKAEASNVGEGFVSA